MSLLSGLGVFHQVKEGQKLSTWRAEDNERRLIDNTRRLVDEKTQQLTAISHLSALVAGFSMVVLVELMIPENTHAVVQILYAVSTALSVCLNIASMFSCVLMLVGVLKYDSVKRTQGFERYWMTHCESEWRLAFLCFILGMPSFLISLAVSAWIKFEDYRSKGGASYIAPISVTIISGLTVLFWMFERQKWGKFLQYLSTNTAKEVVHKDSSSNSPANSPIGPHGQKFFGADGDYDEGKEDNTSRGVSPTHTDEGIELNI